MSAQSTVVQKKTSNGYSETLNNFSDPEGMRCQTLASKVVNTGNSPLNFVPVSDNIGLWQKDYLANSTVISVEGVNPTHMYYQSFNISFLKPGISELGVYGFECPGEPATLIQVLPVFAMASPVMTVTSINGSYSVGVDSVNPNTPVSFRTEGQDYNSDRQKESFLLSTVTDRFPERVAITTYPTTPMSTIWGQNPIKVTIMRVTSDQGEFTGNSAVLYGYYLEGMGQVLNFYLDQQQSMTGFQYGQAGVNVTLDQAHAGIFVG